jgi:aromatic-amino-acid transaminase
MTTTPMRLIPERKTGGGDDPIFALNAEANRRKANGEEVVNSTLGVLLDEQQKLCTLPSVLEAFRRVDPARGAAYAPIAGPRPFLDAVRQDVFGSSSLLAHSTAVATPGGTGALALAVQNFLEAGQAMLTPQFYWGPYDTIAGVAGRRVETFAMFDADGRFHVAALEQALLKQERTQGRALLVLNTPCNNPTGYSLDARDYDGLVPVLAAAARRMPLTVLMDVAYARYANGDAFDWVERLQPLCEDLTLLVAWSASKSYAQYGARIGACIAVETDAKELLLVERALTNGCRGTWSNGNHVGLLAITECMTDPQLAAAALRERAELRSMLTSRVAAFTTGCKAKSLRHPRYEGGFFVTIECAEPEAAAARMRELGVFVVPIKGALRVALCSTPLPLVPRLVDALAVAMRS